VPAATPKPAPVSGGPKTDDDAPLPEVPRLRRALETRQKNLTYNNGDDNERHDDPAPDAAASDSAQPDAAETGSEAEDRPAADNAATSSDSEDAPRRKAKSRQGKDKGQASQ